MILGVKSSLQFHITVVGTIKIGQWANSFGILQESYAHFSSCGTHHAILSYFALVKNMQGHIASISTIRSAGRKSKIRLRSSVQNDLIRLQSVPKQCTSVPVGIQNADTMGFSSENL